MPPHRPARACPRIRSRTRIGLAGLTCGSGQLTADQIDAIRASNNQFPFKFNQQPDGVSATLSLPIFNNFQREAQVEQARVARDNAAYDVRARNLQLTTDVTQAYLNLVTAAKTVQLQEQNAQRPPKSSRSPKRATGSARRRSSTSPRRAARTNRRRSPASTAIYDYHKAFAALENAVGRPLR